MSYFKCPDCEKEISIFGESHIEKIAKDNNITNIAKMPINPKIAAACDKGVIELFEGDWLDSIADNFEKMIVSEK